MIHIIPEGTSEPQDFALRDRGEPINGAGLTVGIEIFEVIDGVKTAVADPPAVAWLDEAAGTVRVTGIEDLAVGNYFVRFSLTDAGGKIGYCPNGANADRWRVVAVPNY